MINFVLMCAFLLPPSIDVEVNRDFPAIEQRTEKAMKYIGEHSVSAYDVCLKCCGKLDGITATGVIATPGRTVAVDPGVIPLGTILYIEGVGYRIAEDIGGAIRGHKIDLLMTDHASALKFGRKKLNVYVVEFSE